MKFGARIPSKIGLKLVSRKVAELRQMITSAAINVESMKNIFVHFSALEDRMKVGG